MKMKMRPIEPKRKKITDSVGIEDTETLQCYIDYFKEVAGVE